MAGVDETYAQTVSEVEPQDQAAVAEEVNHANLVADAISAQRQAVDAEAQRKQQELDELAGQSEEYTEAVRWYYSELEPGETLSFGEVMMARDQYHQYRADTQKADSMKVQSATAENAGQYAETAHTHLENAIRWNEVEDDTVATASAAVQEALGKLAGLATDEDSRFENAQMATAKAFATILKTLMGALYDRGSDLSDAADKLTKKWSD